jgi:hypothetical protein
MSDLCLGSIFAEPRFSTASRGNLWLYIQGLVLHAHAYMVRDGPECATPDDEEIPAPGTSVPGVDFGSGTEAQLKAVEELTSALPPQVMRKMHSLAQNYQTELTEGKRGVSEMSFSNILKDVVTSLDTEDILSFVGNIDKVMLSMQQSQNLPEVQALMKSMRNAGAGAGAAPPGASPEPAP